MNFLPDNKLLLIGIGVALGLFVVPSVLVAVRSRKTAAA